MGALHLFPTAESLFGGEEACTKRPRMGRGAVRELTRLRFFRPSWAVLDGLKPHPAGVRGLKPSCPAASATPAIVAPRRGAWIETWAV